MKKAYAPADWFNSAEKQTCDNAGETFDNRFAVIAGQLFDLTRYDDMHVIELHDAKDICNATHDTTHLMTRESLRAVLVYEHSADATADFVAMIAHALEACD